MPIHEKSLIRPENLKTHEHLEIEGIDVSGHWSTFIESRVVKDYNENLEEEVAALPGGEFIHRCWQCGACTNSCTVHAINEDFNPRFWIYLIRTGMEEELLRDKDIIWQCVSCNKCTYACPRDVAPEGVMKATAHWLELKGLAPKSPSILFDEAFSDQVFKTGKTEEGGLILKFFKGTKQTPFQAWLIEFGLRLAKKLPVRLLMNLGIATFFKPRTKSWAPARRAIQDYVAGKQAAAGQALRLDHIEGSAGQSSSPEPAE